MRLRPNARAEIQEQSIEAKPEHLRTEAEEWWLYFHYREDVFRQLHLYVLDDPKSYTPEEVTEAKAAEACRQAWREKSVEELLADWPDGFKNWQNGTDVAAWEDACGFDELCD